MKKIEKEIEDRYLVPAVDEAARILFFLASARSSHMSLVDIYKSLGIHKSKAYGILKTLQKHGLAQRSVEGKGYSLGPGLIELSRRFLDNLSAPALAEPLLEELAKKTKTTAALGLISDKQVFIVSKHEGEGPIVTTMRVGRRFPLTYGCHGKAIAAFLPKKELEELFREKKLYFQGDPDKFDKKKTLADIERCRKDWFAADLEEAGSGFNAVAAPVLGPHMMPIGYIVAVGLPNAKAVRGAGPLVAEAGKTLSRMLGADIDRQEAGGAL